MIKWVRRVILVAIVTGISLAIYQAMQTPPIRVDAMRVARGPLQVTIGEDGRTRIKERYVVSAPLAGKLLRIGIDPGDRVAAGETVVATIQPSDPQLLNPRELAQAEAREKVATASLKQTEPAMKMAKADLTFAESELARQRSLANTRAASKSALEEAERGYLNSAESYRSARFAEEIARFELEQARAALLPARKPDTDNLTELTSGFEIRAPIHGRVLRLLRESSSIVAPGTELLEIGDATDLELEIDVLSSDAVKIRSGHRVIIEHWGGAHPLRGVVRLVEPSAYTKISALGVEEQRVNVIIDIADPVEKRESLGDGFRVEVKIIVWSADDVLKVPSSALFRDGEHWYVFRIVSGIAKTTKIELGQRNVNHAAVLAGLAENDQVILHPSDQITDGTYVDPRSN